MLPRLILSALGKDKLRGRYCGVIQGEVVFLLPFVIKKVQTKITNEHFPFTISKEVD